MLSPCIGRHTTSEGCQPLVYNAYDIRARILAGGIMPRTLFAAAHEDMRMHNIPPEPSFFVPGVRPPPLHSALCRPQFCGLGYCCSTLRGAHAPRYWYTAPPSGGTLILPRRKPRGIPHCSLYLVPPSVSIAHRQGARFRWGGFLLYRSKTRRCAAEGCRRQRGGHR